MPFSVSLAGGRWLYRRRTFASLLVTLTLLYLSSPGGLGGVALFATAIGGLTSCAVGPVLHRPANRRPWQWLTACGALFLLGLLLRFRVLTLPSLLGDPDLWAFGGYVCAAGFLRGLLRRTHTGPDPALWLDTGAIIAGSVLVGWVMNIAPQLTAAQTLIGPTVVNTVYPVMDTTLLALTVQLAFRRGADTPSLQAAIAGLAALLLGDLGYTFVWAITPGGVNPYVNVFYLLAYACLGLMATHPSMRELSDVDVTYALTMSRSRLTMVFFALVTPASIPIMLPTHGVLDGIVRGAIMGVLGALVFLRLLGSIQALRRAEAEAQRRATHDALTGLPNRVALLDGLSTHLSRQSSTGRHGWVNVLFLDCDRFKQINDSWGHPAGDEVLIQFAERLRTVIPPDEHLARFGGDEFVLQVNTEEAEQAIAIAEQILTAFRQEPLTISTGRRTLLTPSIGIAQAPYASSGTAEELIRNADLALYEAKAAGRGTFAVYDSSMHQRVARRHELADSLRTAVPRGEIVTVFQQIRSGLGFSELSGWEALARWDHPAYGPVSPVEFIPIAEDTGLVVDIGAFILRQAATQLREWQDLYQRNDLHMSVNVSSVQLLRDDIVGLVSEVLNCTGLAARSLWLEITESVILERTEETLSTLNALNRLGVKLCMDDFGTGYSSLSYLKHFTINILKIDRVFTSNLVADQHDRELTKAMIDVAAALRLEGVVAEGVEIEQQAVLLEKLGCTFAQGYLFGGPAARADATAAANLLLSQHSHDASTVTSGTAQSSTVPMLPRPRERGSTTPHISHFDLKKGSGG